MADETHYSLEDLQRVFAGRSTGSHEERVAAHLLGCRPCRLLAARVLEPLMRSGNLRLDGPLRWAADLQHMEQTRLTEGLDVRASWAEIRTMSWKARRDKVRLTRRLHSEKFLELLLTEGAAAAPAEAEEIFQLALLTAGSLPIPEHSAEEQNDRRAQCYAEVGNARRLQAKWGAADDALQRGAEHAPPGSSCAVR